MIISHRLEVAAITIAVQRASVVTASAAFLPPASFNARTSMVCDPRGLAVRVLIVDDSRSFLDAARVLLELEGLTIVGMVSTSAEALRAAEAVRPDVVLVDIMLAGESGFDLARSLVADDHSGESAVILVSTHAEADFADLIADSPAAGFLPKSDLSADAIGRVVASRSR
jgi:DNA-binding NarL/FixJ family response regulator